MQKVVARFFGKRDSVRGYTHDFFPTKDFFHIQRHEAPPGEKPIQVTVNDLKALFFVKDFEADPATKSKSSFMPLNKIGRKIQITFKDGERLLAHTENYHPGRKGFFAFPMDVLSNNEKLFVVSASVASVVILDDQRSGPQPAAHPSTGVPKAP
jgi:hypothetical protein